MQVLGLNMIQMRLANEDGVALALDSLPRIGYRLNKETIYNRSDIQEIVRATESMAIGIEPEISFTTRLASRPTRAAGIGRASWWIVLNTFATRDEMFYCTLLDYLTVYYQHCWSPLGKSTTSFQTAFISIWGMMSDMRVKPASRRQG
jgi:hypothetical protein